MTFGILFGFFIFLILKMLLKMLKTYKNEESGFENFVFVFENTMDAI